MDTELHQKELPAIRRIFRECGYNPAIPKDQQVIPAKLVVATVFDRVKNSSTTEGALLVQSLIDEFGEEAQGRLKAETQLTAKEEELERAVGHDRKTGLASEAGFRAKMGWIIPELQRGHLGSAAVILIDLNDFRKINNRLGHVVGDQVLKAIGDAIKSSIREVDLGARFGGDELLIVLENASSDPTEAVYIVLNRLQQALDKTSIVHNGEEVHVTCSMGIALVRVGDTIESVLARADSAMYRNKAVDKNDPSYAEGHALKDGETDDNVILEKAREYGHTQTGTFRFQVPDFSQVNITP